MREKILNYIERNSRIELHDLAVMLDAPEADVMNELEQMEAFQMAFYAQGRDVMAAGEQAAIAAAWLPAGDARRRPGRRHGGPRHPERRPA